MIDYEVNIFDRVYRKAAPKCAKGKFVSIFTPSPTAFPAGSLYEISNRTVRARQSSTPVENFAQVTYQLDVYAKTKAEAKEVYNDADVEMTAMGFTRISGDFLDMLGNPDYVRYTARYTAEIDPDGVIYRTP